MVRIRKGYAIIILMIMCLMPLSVMAASNMYVSKVVATGEGWKFSSSVIIDVKDATVAAENQVIYITIENAKFDEDLYIGIDTEEQKYKLVNSQQLQVTLSAYVPQGKIYIPIYGITIKGDATLNIDGSQTQAINDGTLIIARSVDARATITAVTPTKINGWGEIAKISVHEPFAGVLQGKDIFIMLQNNDYKFTNAGQIKPLRGLTGVEGFNVEVVGEDEKTIKITVPTDINNKSSGRLDLENVEISCLEQNPITEDIQVDIRGEGVVEQTLIVAKVEGIQVTPSPEEKTKQFLNRLYQTCLGREADEEGVNFWFTQLQTGNSTGADLAEFFVNSIEFKNKGLSNKEYIETMYQVFFNRDADTEGLTYWENELNQGLSRNYALVGFVNSEEYQEICDNYEIYRGSLKFNNIIDQYPNTTKFIYRLYLKCMNRTADVTELQYWVEGLVNESFTGKSVAGHFTNSEEFLNAELSNEAFMEILYRVFFDRVSDEDGMAYWISKLEEDTDRLTVLEGFINSMEYIQICADYGITYE